MDAALGSRAQKWLDDPHKTPKVPRLPKEAKPLGGNQTAFAKRLGLGRPVVSESFSAQGGEKKGFSFLMITAVAEAGFSADWLFTGEGSMWRVPAQEAVGEAMPLELDLGELKAATKFAQGQAKKGKKNLERARTWNGWQERLDAKEDLLDKKNRDIVRYRGIIKGLRKRIIGLNEEPALGESRLRQIMEEANRLD